MKIKWSKKINYSLDLTEYIPAVHFDLIKSAELCIRKVFRIFFFLFLHENEMLQPHNSNDYPQHMFPW